MQTRERKRKRVWRQGGLSGCGIPRTCCFGVLWGRSSRCAVAPPTNNDTATQITIITVQSIAKSDDWERLSQ